MMLNYYSDAPNKQEFIEDIRFLRFKEPLNKILFKGINLEYCKFENLNIENVSFINCDVYHSNFKKTNFLNCKFINVEFVGCIFSKATFENNFQFHSKIHNEIKHINFLTLTNLVFFADCQRNIIINDFVENYIIKYITNILPNEKIFKLFVLNKQEIKLLNDCILTKNYINEVHNMFASLSTIDISGKEIKDNIKNNELIKNILF